MAKISFTDNSFIEIRKSVESDKFVVLIQAKDGENALKKITNCVEISKSEFDTLIADIK